ncbi:hypothetical protein EIP91_003791 [Steccherinum ochraceum]|uniref:DUF6593 domain-containing protein n=1 Tax=Steccherinum ochraceum TaxID=92696 RepID=A0A4V6N746_9APHY|nr:hypothetical protein EIP91_003791 [Steccherinum ochraceum]
MSQKLVLTTTSLHNVVISNASDVIYYEIVTPKWERHLTKVSRLDPNTRLFDLVGELQNEDDKPVAMRLYGGSFRSTQDFLKNEPEGHGVEASSAGSQPTEDEKSRTEKLDVSPAEDDHCHPEPGGSSSKINKNFAFTSITAATSSSIGSEAKSKPSVQPAVSDKGHKPHNRADNHNFKWCEVASFNGKDGRKYTWRGDQKHLELLREDMPDYPVATYHRQKRYMYVLRMSQHPYLEVDSAAMDTLDSLILIGCGWEELKWWEEAIVHG